MCVFVAGDVGSYHGRLEMFNLKDQSFCGMEELLMNSVWIGTRMSEEVSTWLVNGL